MSRVASSQLKAKLGRYLRAARQGKEITITDRDEPVAKLVPYVERRELRAPSEDELMSTAPEPGAPALSAVKIVAISFRGTDSMALLREDRSRR